MRVVCGVGGGRRGGRHSPVALAKQRRNGAAVEGFASCCLASLASMASQKTPNFSERRERQNEPVLKKQICRPNLMRSLKGGGGGGANELW